jgi:hypothetical protein
METILVGTLSQTPLEQTKPIRKGKLIDATTMFPGVFDHTFESNNETKIEENTIIAKDFDIKVEVPIYVKKGEKVTFRVLREYTRGTSTKTDSSKISRTNDSMLSRSQESVPVPKIDNANFKEYVETLQHQITKLNDIIKEKEADDKMDKLQIKFKYFRYYSFVWGLSAVLASIFICLGLLRILPAFPAISGVLAVMAGIVGAYLDWKGREQKYDS